MAKFDVITPESLKAALQAPGRTQAGLARRLGLDTSAVNRMVNGKRQIKARELAKIQDYLKSTDNPNYPEEFVGRVSEIRSREGVSFLNAAASGIENSTRDFIIQAWANVFGSLRSYLKSKVQFFDQSESESFWKATMLNTEPLILMGLGDGIVRPAVAAQLRTLSRLAQLTTNRSDMEFEDDPEVIAELRKYLSLKEDRHLVGRTLGVHLAVQSAALSLLLSGEGDKLPGALDEVMGVFGPLVEEMKDLD